MDEPDISVGIVIGNHEGIPTCMDGLIDNCAWAVDCGKASPGRVIV